MEARLFFTVLLFFLIVDDGNSYKVLVYNSKFAHSHSNYLGRVADILVEAGHNVVSSILYFLLGRSCFPDFVHSYSTFNTSWWNWEIARNSSSTRSTSCRFVSRFYEKLKKCANSSYDNSQEVNFFDINMWSPIAPFIVSSVTRTRIISRCRSVQCSPMYSRKRARKWWTSRDSSRNFEQRTMMSSSLRILISVASVLSFHFSDIIRKLYRYREGDQSKVSNWIDDYFYIRNASWRIRSGCCCKFQK